MKQLNFKLFVSIFCLLSLSSFAQKKVMLDYYYNNETSSKTGKPYHYIWEDTALSGFSELGDLFAAHGAKKLSSYTKPSKSSLKGVDVYIIVDPDTKLETKTPNFMDEVAAKAIYNWVKKGGVLLLLTNDGNNCELDSFNLLMSKFGMMYNKVLLRPEIKAGPNKPRNYDSCASINLPNHPLFKDVNKVFLKEVSSITCKFPAAPVLKENDNVYIAEAKIGKGYVLAVGDPWLYNEYIDHAHLSTDFENLKAAKNLVKYLLNYKK